MPSCDVVVDLYDGNRPIIPTGRSERFTRIEIELFSGRSMEAKRALYREQKQAAWRAFEPPSSRQEGQQARHCLDPRCAHGQRSIRKLADCPMSRLRRADGR